MLTDGEKLRCTEIGRKISRLGDFLNDTDLGEPTDLSTWYKFLSRIEAILGNAHNDISFVATVLARLYLQKRFARFEFDAASKSQSAPGLDIDGRTPHGERIVGEIKTTVPYKIRDFGAQQKRMMEKDFIKLRKAVALHKFMFVTEKSTFEILCSPKYAEELAGVEIIELLSGERHKP